MNSKILGLLGFSVAAIPSFLPAQTVQPKPNPIYLTTFVGHPAPVVLELFTSQGCSSCPPAEALLNTWGQDQFKNGQIIPLAFHVDYWDYLGWTDPFSSANYTGRQKAYAHFFDMDSLYTPQAVLGGQAQAVGSDAHSIQDRVKSLSTILALSGLSLTAHRRGGYLDLEIKTTGSGIPGSDWTLSLAVFENELITPVPRGENGGRTLNENFVVRSFNRLYPVQETQTLSIPWDPNWKEGHIGAAAYLQDRRSMRVDSSAAVYPAR
jgi:hypothetical protein